jgi:hypothetical protein
MVNPEKRKYYSHIMRQNSPTVHLRPPVSSTLITRPADTEIQILASIEIRGESDMKKAKFVTYPNFVTSHKHTIIPTYSPTPSITSLIAKELNAFRGFFS